MNVVVLAAHGLNCHWLGPYGNEWVTTPTLDALASEATVFDRHFAATPTAAAFRSEVDPLLNSPGRFTLLVDDRKARESDWRTWDAIVRTNPESFPAPGDALVAAVRDAIRQLAGRDNWVLWVETERLIPPWDLEFESYQHYAETTGGFTDDAMDEEEQPDPTDSPPLGPMDVEDRRLWHQIRNSFAAAVSSFDGELGRLIELFRQSGLEGAAWVVTSGHGLPLGEHGVVGTARSRMHVELTQLPLIVRIPGMKHRRIASFTQPADLSKLVSEPTPALTDRELIVSRLGPEVAVRTAEWTFLQATGHPPRLYVRPDDLWEVNDVAARYPDECDRLAALVPEEAT
jgi:hypothetical protein